MSALFDVILPVFLVLGFGYFAVWRGLLTDEAVDGLMRFAQNFALPCLLFRSIADIDLAIFDLKLMLSFYSGALTAGFAGFWGARLIFGRPATDSIAIAFTCAFSNSLLLGLPITERAYGAEALAGNYAIIAVHSPLLYGLGITSMELARSWGKGLPAARVTAQVLRAIFTQPLVIGIMCGLALNLSGLGMPLVLRSAIDLMARAAIPAALFGLGGVLFRYRPEGDAKTIAMICACTLMLHPAITYGLGHFALDLTTDQLRSAVVTSAVAPGVNAYLFAHMYGVAKRVIASAVLMATALTFLTAWFWLHLLP